MGFLNPKQQDDEQLPGSGVSIDLDTKICPNCRREVLPWEARCAECDVVPVPPDQVPATEMLLPPGLAKLAEEDDENQAELPADPGSDEGDADDPVGQDEPPTAS